MFMTFLQVGLGGAIGAMLRFGLVTGAGRITGGGFPVGVLMANVVGSFLMGLIAIWATQRGMQHLTPFLMTGILGGFTTFSAFSLEAVTLWERGDTGQAALYVGLSVVLSILGLALGAWIMRGALA
jgi:CrcB protein